MPVMKERLNKILLNKTATKSHFLQEIVFHEVYILFGPKAT